MTISTMFLNNLSVVDHAYVSQVGTVVGGSYNPSFLVSGEVTDDESVVIDFSTCKKSMKKIIDDDVYGFDHKLWIVEDYSYVQTVEVMSSTDREYTGKVFNAREPALKEYMEMSVEKVLHRSDSLKITTPHTVLVMPRDAIKWVANPDGSEDIADIVTEQMSLLLEDKLNAECEFTVGIVTELVTTRHQWQPREPVWSFRYTHGLKNSTSWGCQNVAHGHLSFVEIELNGWHTEQQQQDLKSFMSVFMRELHSVVFIYRENVKYEDDDVIQIEYTTPRGTFAAEYDKGTYEIAVLDTETTIEYLVDYMVNGREGMRDRLVELDVKRVFVSEGLSKGAVIEL